MKKSVFDEWNIKRKVPIFLVGVLVVSCSIAGYFIGISVEKEKYTDFLKSFRTIRENSDKYTYINPLIGGVSAPATDVAIYSDIKSEILSYLKKEEKSGNLFGHSFYFRDMNTGLWFGDHESDNFFPASLLKLPIAIAVYKQVESEASFLKKQLLYTQELASINSAKQLNAESTLVVGQSYPVDQLVEKMLTISDNGAKNLLLSALDKSYLDQLLKIVNFADPDAPQSYEISSRKYANFLRILYGSSYINEEHSEFILELLAKSEFRDGLVAGLPKNVQIAHKFGVYEFQEEIKGKDMLTVQLHDCGVVYHPSKPFIICFMTKGKDDASLFKIISHVSQMVYEHQDTHNREGY